MRKSEEGLELCESRESSLAFSKSLSLVDTSIADAADLSIPSNPFVFVHNRDRTSPAVWSRSYK